MLLLLVVHLATAQGNKPVIKVMSSTFQDWIGGAKGMSGTTYTIKVRIMSGKDIQFKDMWLGKKSVPFEVQTFFTDPNKKPSAGDSVLLVYVKRNQLAADEGESKPLPTQYKGEALIKYLVAGKPKYIAIKSFNRIKTMKGI